MPPDREACPPPAAPRRRLEVRAQVPRGHRRVARRGPAAQAERAARRPRGGPARPEPPAHRSRAAAAGAAGAKPQVGGAW
ncbi:Hypothetical predicted protein [Marmota monax]|uniref:Uncharacterized protein n=1 Tax=Marmota monax TaxID=9995 RepID=A0A5E4B2Q3_MARMO|nr:hypothetical protein GHT09_005438 [Marmota monax]VTJ63430.1 Hypothetical predicted protein [Marmota monax]